jgi:2-polyprenyl-3-methyl-5-hydroxy-6-metoxy-1,4-benzoquinol methylase
MRNVNDIILNPSAPSTFGALVAEIVACSDLDDSTVRDKLWQQITGPGNVEMDARVYGVTPHHFDVAMERLYRESHAFVFETLLYGQRAVRRGWLKCAAARIDGHAKSAGITRNDLKILMFGDGCGEDSLALVRDGLRVEYFDLPGSRTFEFARRRFAYHGASDSVKLHVSTNDLESAHYDVVLSFEVLEHLTDPAAAIATMARVLKPGGIALASDAFETVNASFPTHLASNYDYRDTTPYLFLRHGLALTWTNRVDWNKPMEFARVALTPSARYRRAVLDGGIRKAVWLLIRRGRWRDLGMAPEPRA